MSVINGSGGTSVYIRQNGNTEEFSINQTTWAPITWPCTLVNTSPGSGMLEVIFTTDLKIQTSFDYFVIGSEKIQIGSKTLKPDGTRPKIIIEIPSPLTYDGLVRNGTSGGNGRDTIEIYNLEITVTLGARLSTGSGWLGQEYYMKGGRGGLIVNCSSDGAIGNGGGITGNYTCADGGELILRACSSSGAITGGAGGIIGADSATGAGSQIAVERCWTSGSIGGLGGGICGNSCGGNGGQLIVTNSYSTGAIQGAGGGIYGASAGAGGSVLAGNCYSTGAIESGGGGIYGQNAGTASGTAFASVCYSTGNINSGGGIYGPGYANATAQYCYTTGSKSGSGGGIYHNSTNDNVQGANNYSESNNGSSGWNSIRAKMTLVNVPTTTNYGVSWCDVGYSPNTPFILTQSAYSPYSLELVDVMSQTIEAGQETTPGVIEGYGYQILEINGADPSEFPTIMLEDASGYQFYGQIKTTIETPPAVYTLRIYSTKNPYGVTTYTLTVTAAPPLPSNGEISCCDRVLELKGLDYETRNNILAGNIMIGETTIRKPMMSYSDYYKMKMAYASKR